MLNLLFNLVEEQKLQTMKLILDNMPQIKEDAVRMLSTETHVKVASNIIKDYKMNPQDFPELEQIIMKNSSCYFIGRAFRNPSHADYLPLNQIEDLFTGKKRML